MDFKRLIFISGKGGTGKTSMALRLSRLLSEKGRRVLFVELGSHSSACALLGLKQPPGYKPTPSGFGFDWSLVQAFECLSEYLEHFLKIKKMTHYLVHHPFVRKVMGVAPGLNDLVVLGKLTSGVRKKGPPLEYDHVVVDAFSTGSFASFLEAPGILGESMGSGLLQKQSFSIKKALQNKREVQYFFVSLFEQEVVDELEETLNKTNETLKDQISVIMNKYFRLESINLPDLNWQDFIKKKLTVQRDQFKRVLGFCKNVYFVDRHILPLEKEIQTHQGGFLRTPLNH